MSSTSLPPALVLMGPTASGKTALSIQLAQALDCEIISVDASMVYRGMDIGTAKPTIAERQGVPHHLIDILDPSEPFSTGRFRGQALNLMADITARGRLPLLVGGTMLYFNALLKGLAELPSADPALRRQIDEEAAASGWLKLHRELRLIDPVAAARIHPNDPQRIQRALEVYRITGQSLTSLWEMAETQAAPFRFIRMVVSPSDREVLHQRIRERFLEMLARGLIDEVRRLYRRGDLNASLPSIRAVGYRQVWGYLQGEYDDRSLVERAVIATRQFAKRQYTWLRREASARHYVSEDDNLSGKIVGDLSVLLR